jgi:hypothetical protein
LHTSSNVFAPSIAAGTTVSIATLHAHAETWPPKLSSGSAVTLPVLSLESHVAGVAISDATTILAPLLETDIIVYEPTVVSFIQLTTGSETTLYVGLDMYKRNDPHPEPILSKLFRISDGSPIEDGVTVRITTPTETKPGEGTLQHLGDGKWIYVPTQAETNHPWFAVEFVHDEAVGKGTLVQVWTTPVDLTDLEIFTASQHAQTRSIVVSDILDNQQIEQGLPMRKVLRALTAVLVGQSSGGGTPMHVYKTPDGSKERVRGNVDSEGNRLRVNLNLD